MFVRIYTGADGQTHFEDLELPAERAVHSGMQVTPGVNFRRFEPGYFSTGTTRRVGSMSSRCPARWKLASATALNGGSAPGMSCWRTI